MMQALPSVPCVSAPLASALSVDSDGFALQSLKPLHWLAASLRSAGKALGGFLQTCEVELDV